MKKLPLLLIIVLLCLSLVACEPSIYHLAFIQSNYEITSIELIDYDNPDQLVVRHGLIAIFVRPVDYAPFANDNCTLIETLPEEKKEAFIEQMNDVNTMKMGYSNNNSPKGICLKITCSDGNFFIVDGTVDNKYYTFCAEYSADGEFIQYYGEPDSASVISLINDYFEYQASAEEK